MTIRRTSVRAACALILGLAIWVVACSSGSPGRESSGSTKQPVAAEPPEAPIRFPGVAPPSKTKAGARNTSGCGSPLVYMGGPILQNVKVYSVFWTANIDPNVKAQIGNFYTDILASSYMDWLSEYDTVGVVPMDMGASSKQGISRGKYMGATTITPALCNSTSPCTIDDSQVQTELAAQWSSGKLPKPTVGCDGLTDSIYMIEFPDNVTITATIGGSTITSCQAFCAYHYNTVYMGTYVPYGIHPNMETGPCASVCSTMPPATFNDSTSVHSHELVEAITDADVTITGGTYVRPAAWGSPSCGEIGDECNFLEQMIKTDNGHMWNVQMEWSNLQNTCTVSGTPKPVCTAANTPPGCRACTCSDNQYGGPTKTLGCDGATSWCETDATNVKTGDCVACTTNAECTTANTYCEKSTTAAMDDVCAPCGMAGQVCCPMGTACVAPNTCGGGGKTGVCGCTKKTACPAGDNCGTVSDGCGGMITCGTCMAPDTCGGAGTANQCGCTPMKACAAGANCGMVSDGCTGMLNCGSCTAPQTCGGGGTPNQCGCTPLTACPNGDTCGSVDDGCGGMVMCGTCSGGQTCSGNVCSSSSGCGCRTAGAEREAPAGLALGGLIVVGLVGRRRSARTKRRPR